jgi:hypothetical protein
MTSIQSFWARVKDRRARLTEELAEQPWHRGGVFLVSVDNSEKGVTGGVVMTVPLELAAQCLTKATHRLCDESEVLAYKAEVNKTRQSAKDVEVLNKTKYLLETK